MLSNLKAWKTMLALGSVERRLAFLEWLIHADEKDLVHARGVGPRTAERVVWEYTMTLRELDLDFSPDAEPQLVSYTRVGWNGQPERVWVHLDPERGFFAIIPREKPKDLKHLRRALGQYIQADVQVLSATQVAAVYGHFETVAPPPGLTAEPLPDDLSGIRAAIYSLLETFESLPEAKRDLARDYIAQHLGLKG